MCRESIGQFPITDGLRRQEAMKTADRENPIRGATWPRNRAHGAVGQNRTRSIEWAEKQEKFHIRTYQALAVFPTYL
jgi:hypothetical protein